MIPFSARSFPTGTPVAAAIFVSVSPALTTWTALAFAAVFAPVFAGAFATTFATGFAAAFAGAFATAFTAGFGVAGFAAMRGVSLGAGDAGRVARYCATIVSVVP